MIERKKDGSGVLRGGELGGGGEEVNFVMIEGGTQMGEELRWV